MGLYEKIVNDPELKRLMSRLETWAHKTFTARGCVAELSSIYGIAGTQNGQVQAYFLQKEPTERTEDAEKKLEEIREKFQGPFVIYMNALGKKSEKPPEQENFHEHYYCFTGIEDGLKVKGKWLVEGYDADRKHFSKVLEQKEMEEFRQEMFEKNIAEALFHETGTHIYTIVRHAVRVNNKDGKTLLIYSKIHDLIICEEETKKIEIEGTGIVPECR